MWTGVSPVPVVGLLIKDHTAQGQAHKQGYVSGLISDWPTQCDLSVMDGNLMDK